MILVIDGDVELIFTPENGRLKLQFKKGGGISRILSETERKKLSKALWYSAPISSAGQTPSSGTTTIPQ